MLHFLLIKHFHNTKAAIIQLCNTASSKVFGTCFFGSITPAHHPVRPAPSQNSHNGNKPSRPVAQSMKPVWINKGTPLYWCICGHLLTDTVWSHTIMLGTLILFPWLLMEFPNSSEWEWSASKNRPPAVSVLRLLIPVCWFRRCQVQPWFQCAGMNACVYMHTLMHTYTCRHMHICRHMHAHMVEPRHIQKHQTDTFLKTKSNQYCSC